MKSLRLYFYAFLSLNAFLKSSSDEFDLKESLYNYIYCLRGRGAALPKEACRLERLIG